MYKAAGNVGEGIERYGGDVFNVLWSVFSRLLSERNIGDVIFRYA